MRRYWIEASSFRGDHVLLEDEVFHHIFKVCRQAEGDKFEVLKGDGEIHLVEVTRLEKKRATATLLESRKVPARPRPHLHLVLSVPKFPVLEAVLQKSVELGVHSLHLVPTDFSFIKKRQVLEQKLPRWNKIIQGACQQSGRPEPMELNFCEDLKNLLSEINRDEGQLGLFFYEGQGQVNLRTQLSTIAPESIQDVYYFVGSEGGFSEAEVELFSSLGHPPITLGSQVLRVETACVCITSVLKYVLEV